MATINNAWSNARLSNTSIASDIDNQHNNLSTDVQDRGLNSGQYWPNTASAASGVNYCGTDAYQAGSTAQWNIWDTTRATRIFTVKDAGVEITGTLDVSGQVKHSKWKTLVVQAPEATDNIYFSFFDDATTITKVVAILKGTSPSVDCNLYHDTDRSTGTGGNKVYTADETWNSTTTGNVTTASDFADATVPADSHLWFYVASTTGTVDEIAVTVIFKED